jgi:hypothetical protein
VRRLQFLPEPSAVEAVLEACGGATREEGGKEPR